MKVTDYTLTWQESDLELQTPFKVLHVRVLAGYGAELSILEPDPVPGHYPTRFNFYIAVGEQSLPRLMDHVGSSNNPGFPAIHVFMEKA